MASQLVTNAEKNRGTSPLVGVRNEHVSVGKKLAEDYPEQMKALLAPHLTLWVEQTVVGLRLRDRTAMRVFPEIMGALGAKSDLIKALVISVGANSPEHLKSAASSALDAEQIDEPTAYAQALDFVRQYRREHGLPALVEVPVEEAGEVPGA